MIVKIIEISEGRLWIHAASKVPDVATIKAMENFYREIYALDGVTDLKFPDQYPISRIIGTSSHPSSRLQDKVIDTVTMHVQLFIDDVIPI